MITGRCSFFKVSNFDPKQHFSLMLCSISFVERVATSSNLIKAENIVSAFLVGFKFLTQHLVFPK